MNVLNLCVVLQKYEKEESMKIYNLFISHSWAHSDSYDRLVNLLEKRSYFGFRNYSVPRNDPIHTNGTDTQLRNAIYRKIQPCSVIIILAGVYSTYSRWINIEIDIAQKKFYHPKPILALHPWGIFNRETKRRSDCSVEH